MTPIKQFPTPIRKIHSLKFRYTNNNNNKTNQAATNKNNHNGNITKKLPITGTVSKTKKSVPLSKTYMSVTTIHIASTKTFPIPKLATEYKTYTHTTNTNDNARIEPTNFQQYENNNNARQNKKINTDKNKNRRKKVYRITVKAKAYSSKHSTNNYTANM